MNLLEPCRPAIFGEMRPEEADQLDVLLHLLEPEVVVETGTLRGGSARLFARHARVLSVDPNPQVTETELRDMPHEVQLLRGYSPQDLDALVLPRLNGVRRWLFFHDSVHSARQLVEEVEWALGNGALAAVWHDVALRWFEAEKDGSMLEGLQRLRNLGYCALRLSSFGIEEADVTLRPPDIWTGLGLAWQKSST